MTKDSLKLVEHLLALPQYSLKKEEKEELFLKEISLLTEHHLSCSTSYAKIFSHLNLLRPPYHQLAKVPFLPINVFKEIELLSIPSEKIYKTLLSSGTTATIPSKIFLDAETARLQTQTLASLMTHFLGEKRLPLLIVDSENLFKDPSKFSARGAGVLGMMNFGRDPFYLLDNEESVRHKELMAWLQKYEDEPLLIFGFTFMIWKYLFQLKLKLPKGILMHTGGWKKLQDQSVSQEQFKKLASENLGVQRCHNFYGMAEQVGSVFIECEKGYLHAPHTSEVIIRDPKKWQEAKIGEEGVIEVLSLLPRSYPGHALLTEDLGISFGNDVCQCERRGQIFKITRRVPKAEPRGCSDAV